MLFSDTARTFDLTRWVPPYIQICLSVALNATDENSWYLTMVRQHVIEDVFPLVDLSGQSPRPLLMSL